MILYVSKNNDKLNGKTLDIEMISDHVCLSPKYNVTIKNQNTKILLDSGAFQDRQRDQRLSFKEALQRQLDFEIRVGFISERLVAYDYIDNVQETIIANKFLISKREELKPRQLVLMIQGTNINDYIYCLTEVLKIANPEDCIGFGGVALAGKINEVKFKLLDVFKIGLPLIYKNGNRDIHIFGVGTFNILKEIREITNLFKQLHIDPNEINISCDTASFEIMSVMGNVINTEKEKWEKLYTKEQKNVEYFPADLTVKNVSKALKIINNI